MPSREPELYKDKIEVSLDGRQIFYLFFGGAVIVGMVFVLGVMVGRRVEARGHLDRADPQAASDPLAALDRLERSDNLSFHGALTGGSAPTDVEKAIGELEKRRTAGHADGADKAVAARAAAAEVHPPAAPRPETVAARSEARADGKPDAKSDSKAEGKPEGKPEAKAESKPEAKAEGKPEAKVDGKPAARPEARTDGKTDAEARSEPVTRPDADRSRSDKHDADRSDRKARKHDDSTGGAKSDHDARKAGARGEPVTRPEPRADAEPRPDSRDARTDGHTAERDGKTDGKTEGKAAADKVRFTLQLSSFQDRSEAEAFLGAIKSAGFQPYLTEADVTGKGTFYRVRLGSYRSLEAASDAKAEFEKASKKSAQVMRL